MVIRIDYKNGRHETCYGVIDFSVHARCEMSDNTISGVLIVNDNHSSMYKLLSDIANIKIEGFEK